MADEILVTAFFVFVILTMFVRFYGKSADKVPYPVVAVVSLSWLASLATCVVMIVYLIWT